MAYAYTPGLRVTPATILRKERKLPLPGQILVEVGDSVQAADVIARAELPGNIRLLNVGSALSIPAEDIYRHILKRVGDSVVKGEVLATTKGFFGLFKSQAQSPTDGIIESISEITGQVMIREAPIPVELKAHIVGEVVETIPQEGVILEAYATFIQGIFGIGGEAVGELLVVAESPDEILNPERLTEQHKDRVLVVGALASYPLIEQAIQQGVRGLIAGGIRDADLRKLLGYELGVAITGTEELGITLIITEGFGEIAIAERTFELLKERQGSQTSINGATQIRAGVVRPEIVIPLSASADNIDQATQENTLDIGSPIRIIREPYFGQLGHVTALPIELQPLETEAKVRVLEVEFADGSRVTLPRANVEMIETS